MPRNATGGRRLTARHPGGVSGCGARPGSRDTVPLSTSRALEVLAPAARSAGSAATASAPHGAAPTRIGGASRSATSAGSAGRDVSQRPRRPTSTRRRVLSATPRRRRTGDASMRGSPVADDPDGSHAITRPEQGPHQSKIGPRSRVRLSSKKPGVPATSSTPSQSRPAASPFGAGRDHRAEERDRLAVAGPGAWIDRRADVRADRLHAASWLARSALVVLGARRRRRPAPGRARPRRARRRTAPRPAPACRRWIRVPSAV